MSETRDLQIKISVLDQATGKLGNLAKSLEMTGRQMQSIGKSASMFVTLPLIAAAGASVKFASDMEESMNAVNVVFGEGADIIHEFGENSARAVGLSTAAFNQLAAQAGALLAETGEPMKDVANLTTNLAVRAADMASVMNKDVNQALNAIRSGLSGEIEPLKQFAVMMSQAQVEAIALEEGIWDGNAAMTEQEKILARLTFIMDRTEKFAGDFANTSDSLANSLRIAKGELENASAKLGVLFIPLLTKAINKLSDMVAWFSNLSDGTKVAIAVIGTFLAALGPSIFIIGKVIVALKAMYTAMVAIRAITLATLGPWGIAIGLATALATAVGINMASSFNKASTTTDEMGNEIDAVNAGMSDMTSGASELTNKVENLGKEASESAKKIEELNKELLKTFEDVAEGEKSSKRDLAETLIDQEENVADIKQQLRELDMNMSSDADRKRFQELTEQLRKEETALENASFIRIQYAQAVSEAERRASLTAFERKVEDIMRTRAERLKDQVLRLQEIQQEIQAEKAKNTQILADYEATQEAMRDETKKTTKVVQEEIDKQKAIYQTLSDKISSTMNLVDPRTSRATPNVPGLSDVLNIGRRAKGGPVSSGMSYIVGEKGPELFTPSSSGNITPNNKLGGNIVITGNTFMSDDDAAEKIGDMIIKRLQLNSKF